MITKKEVYTIFCQQIEYKIQSAHQSWNEANESVLAETKGSVGDKHETGRAMAQLEVEKAGKILNETKQMSSIIQLLDPEKIKSNAELGALVETSLGTFYLSSGIGKIEIDNQSFFCIGMNSPIGKSMLNKKMNEKFIFSEKEGIILKIS
jgi:hypothetical protein